MASKLRYLLVLDFEATCGESGFPRHEMEIIEFPTIVYDLQEKKEVGRFHEYVKPVVRPQLTEFCTQLTGIAQVSRFRVCDVQGCRFGSHNLGNRRQCGALPTRLGTLQSVYKEQ